MRDSGAIWPLAISLAVALAGCKPQQPVTTAPESVAAEVKAAIHTQIDAYASRDAARAASILSPDTRSYFHGEPDVVGKPAALASVSAQMALPGVKLEVADESVDVAASGDLAVYHARYRFSFNDPATGKPVVDTGNWVAVFKRQPDGRMGLVTDIVADAPPPA